MTDLTKIDQPFGTLDDATKGALLLAELRGADIEIRAVEAGLWEPCTPQWAERRAYRVAPPPAAPLHLTYDSIDWSHVAKGWDYCARDEDGSAYVYASRPDCGRRIWALEAGGGDFSAASVFSSYVRGTCDWRESLIVRPGVEGAK